MKFNIREKQYWNNHFIFHWKLAVFLMVSFESFVLGATSSFAPTTTPERSQKSPILQDAASTQLDNLQLFPIFTLSKMKQLLRVTDFPTLQLFPKTHFSIFSFFFPPSLPASSDLSAKDICSPTRLDATLRGLTLH